MTIGPVEIMLLLALLPVASGSAFASCSETVLFGLRQSDRENCGGIDPPRRGAWMNYCAIHAVCWSRCY